MKVNGRYLPTLGQALKVMLCAIFRIEMDINIETDTVYYRKPNVPADRPAKAGERGKI